MPVSSPVPTTVSSANGSAFSGFHAQQSDTSSSEELSVAGRDRGEGPQLKVH